jgi:CHAT domain-containing protein
MAAATRLVVVPDGVLWALPFQALEPRAGRYLIEDRAISLAPSLASFVEMSQQGRGPARPVAAAPTAVAFGLAAPGNAALERLAHLRPDVKVEAQPEAPKEAAAVARLYGPARGKAFVGDAATTARFALEAPNPDVLHVAAPGVLNDSSPLASEIAFAPGAPGDKSDALVETAQVMGLDLRADVAFFSRLQGEPGQGRAGEAAVGLAWAMFAAGTPTTVLSSWVVDAPSTTSLALAFHRRIGAAGPPSTGPISPAEALRRATLGLLAAPATRHPYFWAGFTVIGR